MRRVGDGQPGEAEVGMVKESVPCSWMCRWYREVLDVASLSTDHVCHRYTVVHLVGIIVVHDRGVIDRVVFAYWEHPLVQVNVPIVAFNSLK